MDNNDLTSGLDVKKERFVSSDLVSDLACEKAKNESNNLYIMRLEDSLAYKMNEFEYYINNLKKTADEYYRIKENYRLIQEQNKLLANENRQLKKGISHRIKKLL